MREGVVRLNPRATIFELSCRTGEGIAMWAEWLESLWKNL
jgi:Ni2+-binding GTPase involved in maturation of urease and hydrogenase